MQYFIKPLNPRSLGLSLTGAHDLSRMMRTHSGPRKIDPIQGQRPTRNMAPIGDLRPVPSHPRQEPPTAHMSLNKLELDYRGAIVPHDHNFHPIRKKNLILHLASSLVFALIFHLVLVPRQSQPQACTQDQTQNRTH